MNATLTLSLAAFAADMCRATLWRIPDELPPSFSPCHGRIGPGGRDFVKSRRCAGAIADAGCTRRLPSSRPEPVRQSDGYAAGSFDDASTSLLAHSCGLG